MDSFIICFEIILFAVPIINILLFVYYRSINQKWAYKTLIVPILLFILEIFLYINAFVFPVRDGGVFVQFFFGWLIGIFAIISQIITIKLVIKHKLTSSNNNS